MADAPVFIAQYDPAWLAGFDSQRDRVVAALKPWRRTIRTQPAALVIVDLTRPHTLGHRPTLNDRGHQTSAQTRERRGSRERPRGVAQSVSDARQAA